MTSSCSGRRPTAARRIVCRGFIAGPPSPFWSASMARVQCAMSPGVIWMPGSSRASRYPHGLDVHQVLGAREQRALADVWSAGGAAARLAPAAGAAARPCTRRGTASRSRRVDEAEEHEVAQQHAPVRAEAPQQAAPVEAPGPGAQEVRDVVPVVALALHDERLRPDDLLRRAQPHGDAQDLGLGTLCVEPVVVHHRDAAARAVDDVDEVARSRGCRPWPASGGRSSPCWQPRPSSTAEDAPRRPRCRQKMSKSLVWRSMPV